MAIRDQRHNRPYRTGRTNNNPNNVDIPFQSALKGNTQSVGAQNTEPLLNPSFNANSPLNTFVAPADMPIGADQVRKARQTLEKYKRGKANLENRIINNEKWYKMRHWDMMGGENTKDDPKPASGWLFNTIISKHADYMDSIPTADILPREPNDVEEARRLSSIIPVVLEQNGYRNVYSEEAWYKLKNGTGVYGVFWDGSKLNGLGDISINCIDILSLFWEPGIKDIQKSRNIFSVELVDIDLVEQQYPDTKGKLSKANENIIKSYVHDESIDTTNKVAVIDWYYKKSVNGKQTLQYVKFVDDIVLYATENENVRPTAEQPIVDANGRQLIDELGLPVTQTVETGLSMAETGLYDHALYPFVFDVLFPESDMPVGLGFVDVCKNAQASIDIFNNCFEKNVQYVASPRYLSRTDGGINEEEFKDPSQVIVHVDGNLGEDSYAPIVPPTLVNGNYIEILNAKVNEMKEVAGNRDATTGGTTSGVTAASAIAAMQESAGKTSRDQISTSYAAYKEVVNLVIELIRQFYDIPRQFRIIGNMGENEFTQYSNAGIKPQSQGMDFGTDMGYRLPVFDIEVKTEKESAYTQLSQNELALQFYNQGFFNPQYADQALACLDMMEFQGKQQMLQKVQANGGMYQQMVQMMQQMQQMGEIIDQMSGGQTNMAESVAGMVNEKLGGAAQVQGGNAQMPNLDGGESATTATARERANNATAPR